MGTCLVPWWGSEKGRGQGSPFWGQHSNLWLLCNHCRGQGLPFQNDIISWSCFLKMSVAMSVNFLILLLLSQLDSVARGSNFSQFVLLCVIIVQQFAKFVSIWSNSTLKRPQSEINVHSIMQG